MTPTFIRTNVHATLRRAAAPVAIGVMLAGPALATTLNDPAFLPVGRSIPNVIGLLIRGILGVVGIIALVMFVYGGLMWMTSAGNQERVTKAKKTLVWSTIGLLVVLGAGTLVSFVLRAIGV